MELHFGPVVERFKAMNFDALEFQQSRLPSQPTILGGDSIVLLLLRVVKTLRYAELRRFLTLPLYMGAQ
jgi:hypothetical protein